MEGGCIGFYQGFCLGALTEKLCKMSLPIESVLHGNEIVCSHSCECLHTGLLPIPRDESEIDVVSAQLCLLDKACRGVFPHMSGCWESEGAKTV